MTEEEQNHSNLVDLDELRQKLAAQASTPYNWTYANGRRYASTELGAYYMPADEPEIRRLNEQHWILTRLRGGALHDAQLPDEALARGPRVLDVGCGSGIWCLQMAEDYPRGEVVGMDVSPVQPARKPGNVRWVLHDMETETWPFPEEHFDLIHLSLVHGCVRDWDTMVARLVTYLAPAGVLEHQEFSLCRTYRLSPEPPHNPLPLPANPSDQPANLRWARHMEHASHVRGRPLQLGPHLSTFQASNPHLTATTERVHRLPVGTWPEDAEERELGGRMMLQLCAGLEGFSLVMFGKVLGWEEGEIRAFLVEVERELRDDRGHDCVDVHVAWSRKKGLVGRAGAEAGAERSKD